MYKNLLITALILSSANIVFADSFYVQPQKQLSQPVSIFSKPSNSQIQTLPTSGAIYKSLIEPELTAEIVNMKSELKKQPNNFVLKLKLASALQNNGNASSATKIYSQLLEDGKNNAELLSQLESIAIANVQKTSSYLNLVFLGDVYARENKNSLALETYKKALLANPSSKITRGKIADLYISQSTYDKALPLYETILVSSPYSTDLRLKKAKCLAELNRKDEAKAEYKMILTRNASNSEALAAMYEIYANDALSQDDIIKKIYPEYKVKSIDAAICKSFAGSLNEAGKKEDALIFYKKAVALNADDVASYIDMAEIYSKLGQKASAKEALEVAQRILPGDSELRKKYNRAMALSSDNPLKETELLVKNGLYDDAITVYESLEPKTAQIYIGIASCYQYLNKPEEAFSFLDKAKALEPENSDIYYSYAFLCVNQEDYSKSKNYIAKSLTYNPANLKSIKLEKFINDQQAAKLMNNVFTAYDSQRYGEALRLLNEVIKITPNNVDAIYYKGLVLVALNKQQAGINEFNKVAKLKPTFPLVYYSLGTAYDSLGKYPYALTSYRKYLALDKTSSQYVKYSKQRVLQLAKRKK